MDAVLNWLWQGGVVAAASFVMLLALERARANVRYVVCWAALVAVAALPALTSMRLADDSPAAAAAPPLEPMISLPDTWWTSTAVLLVALIIWTLAHGIRFLAAVVSIRRARAGSLPFPERVECTLPNWLRVRCKGRRAALVLSESVSTAAVLGWGAPKIAVAPALVETLTADELDRVLIHEWTHVQRRDDISNIVQIAVRAILGWHPAIWWIDRRLHVEREVACDERAVAITGSAKSYAECLIKLASLRGIPRAMHAAPAVLSSSGLRARIIKIVAARPSIAPAWSRSIAVAIVAVLAVMSIALGGLKLVEAAVLNLPMVSGRPVIAVHRIEPIAVPPVLSDLRNVRPFQTESPAPVTEQPQPIPAPVPQAEHPSETPVVPEGGQRPHSERSLEPAHPEPPSAPLLDSVRHLPSQPVPITAEHPRSPWAAAADGGAAIGRKSKEAGIATAGFFTRFARRVAGSF